MLWVGFFFLLLSFFFFLIKWDCSGQNQACRNGLAIRSRCEEQQAHPPSVLVTYLIWNTGLCHRGGDTRDRYRSYLWSEIPLSLQKGAFGASAERHECFLIKLPALNNFSLKR